MAQPFYITTTLPYVNSDPHIGFALEIIQADAIARYQRLKGREVFFNTGTDEHGLKIYRKSQERGVTPQEFCDEYAAKFDALKQALNLSYNAFIRTTDPDHIAACQEFWQRCEAKGDIYKKNYSVKYCVGCELEKTDSELEDGRCPIHPTTELELIDEENYFFRFSNYQEPLLKLYEARPDFVLPAHRLTEIAKFTEKGLEDFSISRLKEKMPWGVPVPGDEAHVMYVWFDALINYISTLGWPDESGEGGYARHWPGVQIAGKDNLRQQSNMWQGMLMSAGLPPSQQILIHGFITSEGQKMSKSVGNVVGPFEVVDRYGTDALRYYLLKEIPTAEDGDFSRERFEIVYESELANSLGNLLSRVVAMTEKYLEGTVPAVEKGDVSDPIQAAVAAAWEALESGMERFNLKVALESVWDVIAHANRLVEDEKPWALHKEGQNERLAAVLYTLLETLRQVSWMIHPFLPETGEKMRCQLGVTETVETLSEGALPWGGLEEGTTVAKGEPLFPRLG